MVSIGKDNLQAVINAATNATVKLTNDIFLTSRITVSNSVTLDLNGFSVSSDFDDGYGTIYVGTKGTLTITDTSVEKTGRVINMSGNAIGNYGSLTVQGGTFVGKYALYNFYSSDSVKGVATVQQGNFVSAVENEPSIANCGSLIIDDGLFGIIDTSNSLTVKGGKIKTLILGVADYNPQVQETIIQGGQIDQLIVSENSENVLAVKGGSFKEPLDEKYLPAGAKYAYDEGTRLYSVVSTSSNEGVKVIATSSSRVKELPIKAGQLIFVQDLKRIAFDFNNRRVFYNQIVELETDYDRVSLEEPLTGYYFIIETATLWHFKEEWVQISGSPKEIVFIGAELPTLGQKNNLYVNTADKEISIWNDEQNKYVVVSDCTKEITEEDIEALFI
jgi:hypothetical protein